MTLWTEAHQAPLSIGFSRQEYRSGLPYPPPEDLSDQGIKPVSCGSCITGGFFSAEPTGKPENEHIYEYKEIMLTENSREISGEPSWVLTQFLPDSWWKCRMAQPLWRTILKFLKNLKIELPI